MRVLDSQIMDVKIAGEEHKLDDRVDSEFARNQLGKDEADRRDLIAYLKLVTNPRDELSFKRIVQMLPGIGGKGAEKLWKNFQEKFHPLICHL